jgi:hypothetical protein
VPHARLLDYLNADLVLTKDADWESVAVPTVKGDPTDEECMSFLLSTRNQAEARGGAFVGSIGMQVTWKGIQHPLVQTLLLAGVALCLLALDDRQREALREVLRGLGRAFLPSLERFAAASTSLQAEQAEGRSASLPVRGPISQCDRFVRLCVAEGHFELLKVSDALKRHGYARVEPGPARAAIVQDKRLVLRNGQVRLRCAIPYRTLQPGPASGEVIDGRLVQSPR